MQNLNKIRYKSLLKSNKSYFSYAYFTHLGSLNADDAVQVPRGVVEEGHGDSGRTRWHPWALRLWVYVEHVSLAREDWLFTATNQSLFRTLFNKLKIMWRYAIYTSTLNGNLNLSDSFGRRVSNALRPIRTRDNMYLENSNRTRIFLGASPISYRIQAIQEPHFEKPTPCIILWLLRSFISIEWWKETGWRRSALVRK
jgi:hypothetical protein